MKTWEDLKNLYIIDHRSKPLKKPEIRLNALSNIEKLLNKHFPEIIENPIRLIELEKQYLIEKLSMHKGSQLNSAEKSVITGLMIFIRQDDQPMIKKEQDKDDVSSNSIEGELNSALNFNLSGKYNLESQEKLATYCKIADAVNEVLKSKGFITGNYKISEYLEWLPTTPKKEYFTNHWKELCEVYKYINGSQQELDKTLQKYANTIVLNKQEADIYFYEPFQMIVEFDEDQHFNQFRGMTLKSDFYNDYPGFKIGEYARLSSNLIKPGSKKSGFNYLKNPDPLFPENQGSEMQDNRHRQRAFRDFLKDVTAKERGIKPTIRIPAEIILNKRNSLNDKDISKIKEYLLKLPIFNDFDKY